MGRANYALVKLRTEALQALGHEVTVASLHTDGALLDSYPLAGRGPRPLRLLLAIRNARRLLRQLHPDIVDAHGATSYGLIAALAAGTTPYLLTIHGTDLYDHANDSRILAAFAKTALRRARWLYASSESILVDVERFIGPIDPSSTRCFPFGIPLRDDILHDDVGAIREQLTTPENAFVVIHPRQISNHWRLEWIVDRLGELTERSDRQVELWLVYTSPSAAQTEYLRQILARCQDANVAVRDIGPLPYEDLMRHLAASDVFVCAARREMLANSFLEAMYYGALPVVSDVDAFRTAARWDGANVHLVSPDDELGWRGALDAVASLAPEKRRIAAAGNRTAVIENAELMTVVNRLFTSLTENV